MSDFKDSHKISIITPVFNGINTISTAIRSVQFQDYKNFEHIIIDGFSSDGTQFFVSSSNLFNTYIFSEKDNGIYDALNKGILKSTGVIIGILHSDDFFINDSVLSEINSIFNDINIDVVYADLYYVDSKDTNIVIRKWVAGNFFRSNLKKGWMPPHPTLFIRRNIYERFGNYDLSYEISSDYDFILRIFNERAINIYYLPRVITKMRLGGISNGSFSKIIKKSYEDLKVIKKNGMGGILTLIFKNFRKINQFF